MKENKWASALILLLFLGLVVQGAYLFKLHRNISQLKSETSSALTAQTARVPSFQTTASPASSQIWDTQDSPWFNDYGNAFDPFEEMERMQRHTNQMINALFRTANSSLAGINPGFLQNSSHPFRPDIDIQETEKQYLIKVDIPGMERDKINVEVSNHHLIISGERKSEQKNDQDGFYRIERSFGSFKKAIPLPDRANTDEVSAAYHEGVLTVTIPKIEIDEGKETASTKVAVT